MTRRSFIDPIFWLWVPLLFILFQFALESGVPRELLGQLHSEWGPHETLQFFIISLALIVALTALRDIDWRSQRPLGAWFALAALSCFYVAGEEVSWGQHIMGWETSEGWAQINDQQETNVHNTSSWLDQKPRLILLIGIALGGLIFPLLEKYRPQTLPARFAVLYPDRRLFVVALLVVVPHLVEKLGEAMGFATFARVSEVQELYMYYFVLLYLWDLRGRELSKA